MALGRQFTDFFGITGQERISATKIPGHKGYSQTTVSHLGDRSTRLFKRVLGYPVQVGKINYEASNMGAIDTAHIDDKHSHMVKPLMDEIWSANGTGPATAYNASDAKKWLGEK